MKRLKNIGWALLFLFALVSCDKNETENVQNGSEMNIPEGYMKVSFPGETRTTKAPVAGLDTRVRHLRYLIYKQDADGLYKLDLKYSAIVLNLKNGEQVMWPLKKTVSQLLPINTNYRVVFLGNVERSVFAGQTTDVLTGITDGADYADARILAPSVAFDENNMYYLGSADFDTYPTGDAADKKKEVAILLQRIVSRSVLTTSGIPAGQDTGGEKYYEQKYFYSLLNDNHPLGLGEQVFGLESGLSEQFRELLIKDFIFPIAYLLDNGGFLDKSTEVAKWYAANKGSYWSTYNDAEKNVKPILENYKTGASYSNTTTDATYDELPKQTCQLINSLFTKNTTDNYLGQMWAQVKGDNVKELQNGAALTAGSFTLAKQEAAKALATAQGSNTAGNLFTTWDGLKGGGFKMNITMKKVPSEIGLDLAVKKTLDEVKQTITLSNPTDTEDKALNIILLSAKDGTDRFNFTALTLASNGEIIHAMPTDVISNGEILQPNISTTYRSTPEKIKLGAVVGAEQKKICFAYGNLMRAITNYPLMYQNSETIKSVFLDVLNAVYNVPRNQINLDLKDGRLIESSSNIQTGVVFNIPDFSSSNLKSGLVWKVDSK